MYPYNKVQESLTVVGWAKVVRTIITWKVKHTIFYWRHEPQPPGPKLRCCFDQKTYNMCEDASFTYHLTKHPNLKFSFIKLTSIMRINKIVIETIKQDPSFSFVFIFRKHGTINKKWIWKNNILISSDLYNSMSSILKHHVIWHVRCNITSTNLSNITLPNPDEL